MKPTNPPRIRPFRLTGEWERQASNLLSALHLDSIKSRIVVFALLATLIPSLSTTWLSHAQNRRSLSGRIDDELRNVAVRGAREMDLWLRAHEFDVRYYAGASPVGDYLASLGPAARPVQVAEGATRLTDYLDRVRGLSDGIVQLLALDNGGRHVAGAALADTVPLPAGWDAEGQNDIAMGTPYWDEDLGRRVVVFAMPIRTIEGRHLGGLAATVDLDSVSAVLRTGWSSPGLEAFIVDEAGTVIATTGPPLNSQPAALTGQALAALAVGDSAAVSFVGYDGVAALGLQSTIARAGWITVARIPEATAFARISELRNKTLLVLVGLLVVLSLVAYQLALLIVKPLDRLASGAADVATGDFAVDLPVTVGGEVGALTRVFNDMVDRLREGRDRIAAIHGQLLAQNEEFERLSLTDGLTGLVNRRCLMETITTEIVRSRRNKAGFAVAIMDVDHFKAFNDTHGHLVGDEVLRGVGEVLKAVAREPDCAARFGGEEFLVMLPETDLEGGVGFAQRVRQHLAERDFDVGGGRTAKVTMSIGVSTFPDHGETPETVISAADGALYRAKKAGRDQVVTATPKRASRHKSTKKTP